MVNSSMVLLLILIAVIDLKRRTINQRLLLLLLSGSMAAVYASNEINFISSITALMLIFLILSFVYYISRKGLGWGDVKLCSCIAPYLGIEKAFAMLFISMLLCGVAAIILIVVNKANRHYEVPFAPFAAIGTIAVLLM